MMWREKYNSFLRKRMAAESTEHGADGVQLEGMELLLCCFM